MTIMTIMTIMVIKKTIGGVVLPNRNAAKVADTVSNERNSMKKRFWI